MDSPSFPLDDVTIRKVAKPRQPAEPLYTNHWMKISKTEFFMRVDHVGQFYAARGNEVEYAPEKNTTKEAIELYLNGSVYGAILHQRNILPIHGSSFIFKNRGVMVCGPSGAGKSSLTTSFCLAGSEFLTDDVTPLVFPDENKTPHILPFSDRIKLWDDSLEQLALENSTLPPISPGEKKYYYTLKKKKVAPYPLHAIFMIEPGNSGRAGFEPLPRTRIIPALRDEIYRLEFLTVLPRAESEYFQQLVSVSRFVKAVRVSRPDEIPIETMRQHLEDYIETELL